jgi:glutamine amidotransferase
MIKIGIVDYGVGNVRSITNAFGMFDCEVIHTCDEKEIMKCDALVLPGVGAFKHGIEKLESKNLNVILKKYVSTSRPFLGICLGMQMLFDKSSEFGDTKGLGFISGDVRKLPNLDNIKLPHIAWSKIHPNKNRTLQKTILKELNESVDMYHVHSYYAKPKNPDSVLTYSMYNDYKFCSTVNEKNIYGCQYHPEKSGKHGLKVIKGFIDIAK